MSKKIIARAFLFLSLVSQYTTASGASINKIKNIPSNRSIEDPYEASNRSILNFNLKLDENLLKPAAHLYNRLIPDPIDNALTNFFENLDSIPTIFNDLLEVKFLAFNNDLMRFLVNTIIGFGGIFDLTKKLNLEKHQLDFSTTLYLWGYRKQYYLVLPFLGPTTFSDLIAKLAFYPFSPYRYLNSKITLALLTLQVAQGRSNLLETENRMNQFIFDKYSVIKSLYITNKITTLKNELVLEKELRKKVRDFLQQPAVFYYLDQ